MGENQKNKKKIKQAKKNILKKTQMAVGMVNKIKKTNQNNIRQDKIR